MLVLAMEVGPAEAPRPGEYDVKAAFLYNFAKFVKWPEEQTLGPTFIIAVLGEDPFRGILEKTLTGKTILERTVEVRRLSTPEAAGKVQILFIGSAGETRPGDIPDTLEGQKG